MTESHRRPWLDLLDSSRSVRARLALIFGVTMGAVSIFLFFSFPLAVKRHEEEARESTANAVLRSAAASVEAAMFFEDWEALFQEIKAVVETYGEELLYISVLNRDGEVVDDLTIYSGREIPVEACAEWEGILPDLQVYCGRQPVIFQRSELGEIRAILSLEALNEPMERMRRLVAAFAAAILFLGLLASYLSTAVFVKPLQEIVSAAERIARGDLSVRAPVRRADEVGLLAFSFNSMVETLEGTQDELKHLNNRLNQTLDNIPALVAVWDTGRRFTYINPVGVPDPEHRRALIGRPADAFWVSSGICEEQRDALNRALDTCVRENRVVTMEVTYGSKENPRVFLTLFGPVLAESGTVERIVGYAVEITDLRETERALRESETQLRQVHKMEAVGRLAGGVAHDFNNLLTAIHGNAEILMMEAEEDGAPSDELEQIRLSAERGARLTRQLLAFSRHQVLSPTLLDLNELVLSMDKMIRRLIGEHIRVATEVAPVPVWITADQGQVDQVVLNLALNAADAMPDGGTLTISTDLVRPQEVGEDVQIEGEWASVLRVQDTGTGMDEKTQARIFDPFFTTKPLGRGTGLGLATVYGILEQSGGCIRVSSAVGEGSVFSVGFPFTPATMEEEEAEEVATTPDRAEETILVVEDDRGVRELAASILRRQGYRVLAAQDPLDGMDVSGAHPEKIHLLLTDLVMPQMNGRALAERIRSSRPDIRILYMSGYTSDEVIHHGIRSSDIHFIQKPFTSATLLRVVRAAIADEEPAGPFPEGVGDAVTVSWERARIPAG